MIDENKLQMAIEDLAIGRDLSHSAKWSTQDLFECLCELNTFRLDRDLRVDNFKDVDLMYRRILHHLKGTIPDKMKKDLLRLRIIAGVAEPPLLRGQANEQSDLEV